MTELQNALTSASPASLELYKKLLTSLKPLGPYQEEIKKTSIHLAARTAFAGVRLRRDYLLLTIKAEKPLESPRILKIEQVSKSRWHCELKLSDAKEIDRELLGWLKQAYALCS